MTLSTIEETLLKREVALFNAEITKGIALIRAAFDRYGSLDRRSSSKIAVTEQDLASFHTYFNEMKVVTNYYYAGYHLSVASQLPVTPPEFVTKLLLRKAVDEFLAQVDSVQEVAGIAQDAHRQAHSNNQ